MSRRLPIQRAVSAGGVVWRKDPREGVEIVVCGRRSDRVWGLPKGTPEEKFARSQAIQAATVVAIKVPLKVMRLALESFGLIREMVAEGNPNSVTDAGVGALCARTAVHGAWLNVKVNAMGLTDKEYARTVTEEAERMAEKATALEAEIVGLVHERVTA